MEVKIGHWNGIFPLHLHMKLQDLDREMCKVPLYTRHHHAMTGSMHRKCTSERSVTVQSSHLNVKEKYIAPREAVVGAFFHKTLDGALHLERQARSGFSIAVPGAAGIAAICWNVLLK